MQAIETVIGDWQAFIAKILEKTAAAGFDLGDFSQMDHICYRTISLDNYKKKKEDLVGFGTLLGETMVNGRPISTFRLNQPLIYDKWRVDALELPAPKEGKSFKEGLEHSEFVIYDSKENFLKKYSDKEFDLRAADRGINPEIGFSFKDEYAVKFHLLNLPTVVFLENKLGIREVADNA